MACACHTFDPSGRQIAKVKAMKQVLIGGIGNVLLEDDGVGPYVARLLDAR
jgi:hypothetical protein